ncbi:hypothetical protein CFC21_004544 [Triticum aestivum]|uniref:GH3 C-terminal domain-containing protein n=1 Tax=Triticum aestivum TaxID=4565 RepID=A0A3B5Y7I0_WHEAT|nr:hypothetical protein CFC21_004544 [Triticum aestivum]
MRICTERCRWEACTDNGGSSRGASSLCIAFHVFLSIAIAFALWMALLTVQSRGSPHGVSMALYTVHQHKEHPRTLLHLLGDGRRRRRLDGGQGDHRRSTLEMDEGPNAVCMHGRVADGSIGLLEIRVIRPGTSEELMDYAISHGASINQYKVPWCLTFPPIIELRMLHSRVLSIQFSPAVRHWIPTPTRRTKYDVST